MNNIKRIALCTLVFLACSNPALKRGYGTTPDELGKAVVEALNNNSETELHRLRADKTQYINDLWPQFSSPGMTGEFAWGNLNKKCIRGTAKWLKTHGGQNLEFVRIAFTKPTEDYQTFKLRRGSILTVKNAKGTQMDLKILGSVIEKDRYYRLLSYDD